MPSMINSGPTRRPNPRRAQPETGPLARLDPDRVTKALALLAECHPDAFDLVLNAIEPQCGNRAGIFAAKADDWMHCRGHGVVSAWPYDAGRSVVIGCLTARYVL
jgi:hypothetical protein